jgi:hypothetical protein|tara:strand:+ start:933 stop:1877 length:945 start_codon:yes stop_codon:yes gene_type:complete
MSKIYKRPMFRKGGSSMGGIMDGITDREEYNIGSNPFQNVLQMDRAMTQGIQPSLRSSITLDDRSPGDEYVATAMESIGEGAIDPVAQLLIQGGLGTLSERGGGSTIGNIARGFRDPTGQAFANLQNRQDLKTKIKLKGKEIDIASEEAEKDRDLKLQLELLDPKDKSALQERIEFLQETYNLSSREALDRALPEFRKRGDPAEAAEDVFELKVDKYSTSQGGAAPLMTDRQARYLVRQENKIDQGLIKGVSAEKLDNTQTYVDTIDIDKIDESGVITLRSGAYPYSADKIYIGFDGKFYTGGQGNKLIPFIPE